MSGKSKNSHGDVLAGIQLQTSCYGGALPLVYGTTRVPGNMVDYDDFVTISNTQSQGGSSGGSSTSTTYTYTCGAILAVCEGPVTAINRVFSSQAVNTMAFYGLTLQAGARPQTPYSVWTTKHAAKALGYSGVATVCSDVFNLGSSASMPNFAFETTALLATEPDTGSLISLGTGDGTNKNFKLLDANGNAISDSTTPPWSAYVTPAYYLAGSVQSSGFTVGKISGLYYLQFTTAPTNGTLVSWSTTVVGLDAQPSAVLTDFLTSSLHGAGWLASKIGVLSGPASSWQTYCTACGFAISPSFDTQKSASDHVKDMLKATNSEAVWSASASTGMTLNVVPYGDSQIIANGTTYTPNTTALYNLTYDDFLGVIDQDGHPTGDDAVTATRTSISDVYNTIPVEYADRQNAYNTSTVQDPEPVDVALNGQKVGSSLNLHMITRRAHAAAISRIQAQRQVYLRNTYVFKVGWKYILTEPMDLLTITDPKLGLSNLFVRVISIDFPERASEADGITITAEAWPFGVGTAVPLVSQPVTPPSNNTTADPGPTNTPIIFDVAPQFSKSGGPELIIAASGGTLWGGCQVWASKDGSTYSQIGTMSAPCRYGTLTSAMAATGGAAITLAPSLGSLASVSTALATDLQTLCWVSSGGTAGSGGEIVGYDTATLTSANAYTLSLPVRGTYGTAAATHASGSSFVRIDQNVFRYPVTPSALGTTIYVKLVPFNLWGGGLESLASCTAYTYTPTSQGTYANQTGDTTTQTGINTQSGDCLTNLDKQNLLTFWKQEAATQTALDAQAVTWSLSHSVYDATLTTLSANLIAAGAPSGWASTWPDNLTFHSAGIVAALNSWEVAVVAARIALQSACANAAATAAQIAAQANTASVALLKSGYTTDGVHIDGKNLANQTITSANMSNSNSTNLIPNGTSEQSPPAGGWPTGAYEAVNLYTGNGYQGNHCRIGTLAGWAYITPNIPCATGEQYYFECYAIAASGGGGQAQISIDYLDLNQNYISSTYLATSSLVWTKVSSNFTTPAGTCFIRVGIQAIAIYGCGFDNLYLGKVIVAGMLAANSVVAGNVAAGAITTGCLTVANTTNLIPNPMSNLAPPTGGWPAGAWEAVALSAGTPSPYGGYGMRLLTGNGTSQIWSLTPPIPCRAGDTFNFMAGYAADWGVADHGYMLMEFFDTLAHAAAHSSVAYAISGNSGGSWAPLSVTLQCPSNGQYVVFSLCTAQATGNQTGFTGLSARMCNDASVTVDGYFSTQTAGIAQNIRSTNYNPTTTGTAATGFKMVAVAIPSITDITGVPRSDVMFDLGGAALVGGYYAGALGFARLNYTSANKGCAYFITGATAAAGSTIAWSWIAPKMGVSGTPYRIRVTNQAAGGGGMRGAGGGGGATLSLVLTVTDGNVLSGVVASGGVGGTTSTTLPASNTLVYSDGTGSNVSLWTSGTTIATVGAPPANGDSGQISGNYFVVYATGVNSNGTAVSGPISMAASGGGGGAGAGNEIGGSSCGWSGGGVPGAVGCGGGASAFGPGGAGAATTSANGSMPPTFAYGAGGGAPGSAGTGSGANGMPGCILIEYL